MKVVALLLCGLAVAAAHPTWEEFKTTHGRKYVDAEEEQYRRSVFDRNLQYVKEHNEKFEKGESTFNLAMNQFGDMTNEEFNAVMKGYKSGSHAEPHNEFVIKEGLPMAATVDWRNSGAVTGVKDQGQCGSCWSFSATGSLEAQHYFKTGYLISLSEQQLVDCADGIYFNQGCNGGWVNQAFKYIYNYGSQTEASYPYQAIDNVCRYNSNYVAATLNDYVDIPQGSELALQQATYSVGPISVAIDASNYSFQLYYSGVYYEPYCSSSNLDHAVLVVGYGSENGQDYWLVKNSWGYSWGINGYIKMARNSNNHCGIATEASYPLV
ncbi:digestive cysteine proteinase 1 [Procambarus clarkii]|uniref:digestive cysteine proteinase 1 n=1 Tax=Procambarus clarkii TaxID=6728 RepID=UPI001E67368C|nr:digestive cysteine proteinase 1-like [Procambarus clarkii]